MMRLIVAALLVGLATSPGVASPILGMPLNLGPNVNSPFEDVTPALSADGLTLFFASDRVGGTGDYDLYMATRATRSSSFGMAVNLGSTINSTFSDTMGNVSADGLELYFTSTRDSPNGQGDVFVSKRLSPADAWGVPIPLAHVNSASDDGNAEISADGLSLFFQSIRAGGAGEYDLWVSTRLTIGAPFSEPTNLALGVNSVFREGGPTISADGLTLYFDSTRPNGIGPRSIWMAMRTDTSSSFTDVRNVGPGLNSEFVDVQPHISRDGTILLIQSTRLGGLGKSDIWITMTVPEPSTLMLATMGALGTLAGGNWRRKLRRRIT